MSTPVQIQQPAAHLTQNSPKQWEQGGDSRGLGVLRWPVKRTIAWLHQFRRLVIRWERRDDYHQAFLDLTPSSGSSFRATYAFSRLCRVKRL
jgi:hypothetical protein